MTPATIKHKTVCRICRQEFSAAAFVPIINSDKPDERIMKYGMALFQHMATKHPEELGSILMVTCYQMSDPVLLNVFEGLRWSTHQHTRKTFISDQTIEEKLASLGYDAEQIQKLKPALMDMRDYLTEQGQYAPQQPSVLVTP